MTDFDISDTADGSTDATATDDNNPSGSFWDHIRAESFTTETVDGSITVPLSDAEQDWCDSVAQKRAASYESGATEDTTYGVGNTKLSIHKRGVRAEYALAALYDLADVDEGVYVDGDDGTDMQMVLDGEVLDVDVKSSSYEPVWTKQKSWKAGSCDAYVTCYVPEDGTHVKVKGWVRDKRLCQEENKVQSKAGDFYNYAFRSEDPLNPMPEPDSERGQW